VSARVDDQHSRPSNVAPATTPVTAAGVAPVAQVIDRLGSTPAGLTAAEAAHRLQTRGPNIVRVHRVRAAAVLARQFRSAVLVLLLLTTHR
jgi:P-type Mg2+ transporter